MLRQSLVAAAFAFAAVTATVGSVDAANTRQTQHHRAVVRATGDPRVYPAALRK
jgi:hypothetical protein